MKLSKPIQLLYVFCLFSTPALFAQADSSALKVKYTRDFKFNEGIYATFAEFKDNAPSITIFTAQKENNNSGAETFVLKGTYIDSTGKQKTISIKKCFGFYKNGSLYFNQGDFSYYRMFIVGALSHFMMYKQGFHQDFNSFDEPSSLVLNSDEYTEYLLDFETGATFQFTYQNFRDFLKTHDVDLYQELENTKHKRDMIHHFLLMYNEKHGIYFPNE